ncbi:MAG: HAD-IIIA family hydrolase [Deltaproteobacteria bacterium]|jgi:D-glycero-D-manno-heptose 1,7-bisphosphate phosphatase|nr:HAD-IIIA family hydrolase [Deltaproteobacteria bacterium]
MPGTLERKLQEKPSDGTTLKRAVFLDRDGVLNRAEVRGGKPHPPADAESMDFYPEAAGILARLKGEGFELVCVTNQPDVARGTRTLENVRAMNDRTLAELPLDALYVCLHDGKDGCGCRKPKPGMLVRGARERGIDLSRSFMVGDRAGDVGAGRAAGCVTVFIDRGYSEPQPDPPADYTAASLGEAARIITSHEREQGT